jgi:hypothetical protein
MFRNTRREFLGDIGRGMLLAGLGTTLTADLGLADERIVGDEKPLSFGPLESLVALMQETPPDKLTGLLVEQIKSGAGLQTLVAAGALANARTFGGQDYVGFHTFMALAPAFRMAQQLPTEQQPLPVLKVLHRNAHRIQEFGGRNNEKLYTVTPDHVPSNSGAGEYLREMTRSGDIEKADRTFAAWADAPVGEAFNHLQFAVEDEVDVHRVVLAWRAWDTLELAGPQWAHCLLRQSVRYCAQAEQHMIERGHSRSDIRVLLPKLLDEYKLLGRTLGHKPGEDGWMEQLADTIFRGSRDQAADAVAQAITEGFAPDSIAEAMSLAANRLVLHDPGRPPEWTSEGKPVGSCHGDSIGVHASDAANAWRNIVRVCNPRNAVASLIVGAYHTAGQSERSNPLPYPLAEPLAEVKTDDPQALLQEAEGAIRQNDQVKAAAVVARYGQLGHQPGGVFDVMLKFATSEDGALHAEKYYQTVSSEFNSMRPAFRWGQLIALARVTASEYGAPSAGYQEAKKRLDL